MKRKKLIIILISIIIIISLIVISFLLLNKNQLVLKKDTFVFEFGDQVPFTSSYYLKNPEEIRDIDEYKLNIEDKNKFSIVDDKLLSKDAELLEVGSYKLSMKYKEQETVNNPILSKLLYGTVDEINDIMVSKDSIHSEFANIRNNDKDYIYLLLLATYITK